jgi:hypothetical protein
MLPAVTASPLCEMAAANQFATQFCRARPALLVAPADGAVHFGALFPRHAWPAILCKYCQVCHCWSNQSVGAILLRVAGASENPPSAVTVLGAGRWCGGNSASETPQLLFAAPCRSRTGSLIHVSEGDGTRKDSLGRFDIPTGSDSVRMKRGWDAGKHQRVCCILFLLANVLADARNAGMKEGVCGCSVCLARIRIPFTRNPGCRQQLSND